MDNYLGYYFFAPNGRFEACGMFTLQHIIASAICMGIVILSALYVIKSKNDKRINKVLRYTAVVLTILEIIKISHSFIYGDLYLDAWFPLSYCGLFIFAVWMSGFGKNRIKRIGEAYITYGCTVAGVCFLIFPTTSLMSYPIWHYFSIYSLLFHSIMIFTSIIYLHKEKSLTKETFFNYSGFVLGFSAIAIIINCIYNSNLMNLREPYNIPIQLLQDIYTIIPSLYTVLVLIIYICIPLIVGLLCRKIKFNQTK